MILHAQVKLVHGNTTLETSSYYKTPEPQAHAAAVSYPDAHYALPHNGPAYVITAYQAELRHPVPLHHSSPAGDRAKAQVQQPYFIPPFFNQHLAHHQAPVYNAPVVYQQQGSEYPQRIATAHQLPVYQTAQQTPVYVRQPIVDSHRPVAYRAGHVNQAVSAVEVHRSPAEPPLADAQQSVQVADEAGDGEMVALLFSLDENQHRDEQREAKKLHVNEQALVEEQSSYPLENTLHNAEQAVLIIHENQQDERKPVEAAEKVPVGPLETGEPLSVPSAHAAAGEIGHVEDSLSEAQAIVYQVSTDEATEKTDDRTGGDAEPVTQLPAAQSEPETIVFSQVEKVEITTEASVVDSLEELTTTQPGIEVEATVPVTEITERQTEAVILASEEPTIGEQLAHVESITELDSVTEALYDSTVAPEQQLDAVRAQQNSYVVPEERPAPSQEEQVVTEHQTTLYNAPVTTATVPVPDVSEHGEINQQPEKLAAPIVPIIYRQDTEAIEPVDLSVVPLIYRKTEEAPQLAATKTEEAHVATQVPNVDQPSEITTGTYPITEAQPVTEFVETTVYSSTTEASVPVETIVYSSSTEATTTAVPVETKSSEESKTFEVITESLADVTEQTTTQETKTEDDAVEQKTEVTPVKLTTTRAPRPYSTPKRRKYTTTTTTSTTTTPLPPVRTKPDYHRFRKPIPVPAKPVTEAPLLPSFDSASSYEAIASAERINSQESYEEERDGELDRPKHPVNLRNRSAAREQVAFKNQRPYPIVTRRPLAPSEVQEIAPSRAASSRSSPSASYTLRTSRTGLHFPRRTDKPINNARPRAPSDFTRGTHSEKIGGAAEEQPDDHVVAESVNKVQKVSQARSKSEKQLITEMPIDESDELHSHESMSTWTFRRIKQALLDGEEHHLPPDVVVDRENNRIILPDGFALYYLAEGEAEASSVRRP